MYYWMLGCICLLNGLCFADVYDIAEMLSRQRGPCFDVYETPSECDKTLAESFVPENPIYGDIAPETLVYLFTPNSPEKAEALHECGGALPPNTQFDPNVNTEVIIHGWLDGLCRTAWMREMKEQLYQRGDYNVILVDWTWGNTRSNYQSGMNCKVMGEQIGFVINNILRQTGCSADKFHVIGHSFGAMASGFIGRRVPGLRRITGLEPPYYPADGETPDQGVTFRDAKIVDNIHTNAFRCMALGLGDSRPVGDADFYPNGGHYQLSCYPYILTSFLKLDILYALFSLLDRRICSHLQSIQFYKVSINPKGCEFVGVNCRSYASFKHKNSPRLCSDKFGIMGMDYELYHRSDGIRRKFYLDTGLICPYYEDFYLEGRHIPYNASCDENTFSLID